MADKTGIEWTDASWNPIRGCSRVSEGCRNCYAETVANRFKKPGMPYEGLIARGGQWSGEIKLVPKVLDQPLRWTKPRRIFVNSMSDLFHEGVSNEYIDEVFNVMGLCHEKGKGHVFQILTKRPERMKEYMNSRAHEAWNACRLDSSIFPPRNIWLGVSIEDQATADERIPLLLQTPAAVRWISAEPVLSKIALPRVDFHCDLCGGTGILGYWPRGKCHHCKGKGCIPAISTDPRFGTPRTPMRSIDWVVVGGESGPGARPMHPDWARSLRDQCAAAGTPYFFKQFGDWITCDSVDQPTYKGQHQYMGKGLHAYKVGKKSAGRLLDGRTHDEYPEV